MFPWFIYSCRYYEVLRPMILRLTQHQFIPGSVPPLPSIADSKNNASLARLPPSNFDSLLPEKQASDSSTLSNYSLNDVEFFNPELLTIQDMERLFPSQLGEEDAHTLASGEVWHTQKSPAVCTGIFFLICDVLCRKTLCDILVYHNI